MEIVTRQKTQYTVVLHGVQRVVLVAGGGRRMSSSRSAVFAYSTNRVYMSRARSDTSSGHSLRVGGWFVAK